MRTMMNDREDRPTGPSTDEKPLSCEEFQSQLPDLMGGEIRNHPHLSTCQRCTALLEELEYIASIAEELMRPDYDPPDKVWDGIAGQIGHKDEPPPHGPH